MSWTLFLQLLILLIIGYLAIHALVGLIYDKKLARQLVMSGTGDSHIDRNAEHERQFALALNPLTYAPSNKRHIYTNTAQYQNYEDAWVGWCLEYTQNNRKANDV